MGTGQLYLHLSIEVGSALAKGKTFAGRVSALLTAEHLEVLTEEERKYLAEFVSSELETHRCCLIVEDNTPDQVAAGLRGRMEREKQAQAAREKHAAQLRKAEAGRNARDAARAARWAALPLSERASSRGASCYTHLCCPDDEPLEGSMGDSGQLYVSVSALERFAPEALAEAEAYAARLREEAKEAAAQREAEELAKRAAWIDEHGSNRLKLCLAEGIECDAIYYDERLALERAGWRWADDVPGEDDEPRNPPDAALEMLIIGRATLPQTERAGAVLRYWVDNSEYGNSRRGYVVMAEFLGSSIVYGAGEIFSGD